MVLDRARVNQFFLSADGTPLAHSLRLSGKFVNYCHQGHTTSMETVFSHATLEVRRSDKRFQSNLAVVCSDNEESKSVAYNSEQLFPLTENLELLLQIVNGTSLSVTWTDQEFNESFEFACDTHIPRTDVETFIQAAYECMYEHKYQQPRDTATEEDIGQFVSPYVATDTFGSQRLQRPHLAEKAPRTRIVFVPPSGTLPPEMEAIEYLTSLQGDIFLYNSEKQRYILYENLVDVDVVQYGPFNYWLLIEGDRLPPISQPISLDMNHSFEKETMTLAWNYFENDQKYAMRLVVFDPEDWGELKAVFAQCIYEASSQIPFTKSCRGDQEHVVNAHGNNSQPFVSDSSSEDDGSTIDKESESEDGYESDCSVEDTSSIDQDFAAFLEGDSKNSLLIPSRKHKCSFVVRGNKIGTFKTEAASPQFVSSHEALTHDGKAFQPQRMILHQDESMFLFIHPHDSHRLASMDIETGKIVDEWPMEDAVVDIASSFKSGQAGYEPTVVSITSNAVFRVDPRQAGKDKVVPSEYKKHVSKTDFSVVATSESGYVAVGSRRGDIRLFSRLGKMATVVLQPLGDPIHALDISSDGRFVLGTCAKYLMLYDVLNRENHQLGYETTFAPHEKPVPRLLKLTCEHAVYIKEPISFTKAHFSRGPTGEITIITSTGPYIIQWRLSSILKGSLFDYKIQKVDSPIVACSFQYDQKQNMVIALPDNVALTRASKARNPSLQLFTGVGQKTKHTLQTETAKAM